MRFEKFTTKLQEALAEAQSAALGNDNQYIEPQHLLAALVNDLSGRRFNRAADNNQWGVVLDWNGLRSAGDAATTRPDAALAGLRGVLKRFGPDENRPA